VTANPLDPTDRATAALAGRTLSQQLVVGLNKIGMVLKSQAWQDAGTEGLTPTQGQILALLNSNRAIGMRLSEIANALGITAATASDAVAVLIHKQLVSKERAIDDARAIAVKLTPQGQAFAHRVAGWSDFMLSAIDELSLPEQEIFLKGLIKIIHKLQADGYISVARMCVNCQFFQPDRYPDPDKPHHCGFLETPFGDRELKIDCPDLVPTDRPT
jgi:DNA-binding MarR family transcriptional regulator